MGATDECEHDHHRVRQRERQAGPMAETTRWRRSRQLRAYACAVAQKAGTLAPGSDLESWVLWVGGVADDLDPLVNDLYADQPGPFTKPPWCA